MTTSSVPRSLLSCWRAWSLRRGESRSEALVPTPILPSYLDYNGRYREPPLDLDHPDDPVARRWRFWQSSPAPFPRFVEVAIAKCPRDAVVEWLDHLEACDRQREHDLFTGAYVRRRWYEECQPDPLTWEVTRS